MNIRYTSAFDVSGTKSFRLSARKVFGDFGGNEQNRSELFRSFLVPPPDWDMFQVDQRGAEALVVAYLCEAGNYRELFEVGIKPHTYLALNIFPDRFRGTYSRDRYRFRRPRELAELPEWPELNTLISEDPAHEVPYKLGKKTAHAKNYNMGPDTFRKNVLKDSQGTIVLTFAEAKEYLLIFERLFPEVIEWQASIERQLADGRVLYNLFGFPRTFHGRWNAALVREALSYIPQSTIGCLNSMVFTDMAADTRWDMLVNAHDAVVGQSPKELTEEACRTAKKLIARPLTSPRGEIFYMGADAMAGPSWAKKDMRKIK